MKKGKRQGETYADVLSQKRMIKEAIDQSVHDHSIAIEADIKTQRVLWMSVVALNQAFGFGEKRAEEFLLAVEEVANEFEQMAEKHGMDYAVKKLMDRAAAITKLNISPVHEEEMRQARMENKAQGIEFPNAREV